MIKWMKNRQTHTSDMIYNYQEEKKIRSPHISSPASFPPEISDSFGITAEAFIRRKARCMLPDGYEHY